MLTPGILFGITLLVCTRWCLGSLSPGRQLILLIGSLMSFALGAFMYDANLPNNWGWQQGLTWDLVKPCIVGPASGVALQMLLMMVVGGRPQTHVALTVFSMGTMIGAATLLAVDELGWRRHFVDNIIIVMTGFTLLQIMLQGLYGWQLASAHLLKKPAPSAV